MKKLVKACLSQMADTHSTPSSQHRISLKWHYLMMIIVAFCLATFTVIHTTSAAWNKIDLDDDEFIFLPFTSRKVPTKWRNFIADRPHAPPTHHPKLYYPRNCPHFQHSKSCAKPVPSFILAGSEFAGASYVFRMLKNHPQVAAASVDNSGPNAKHVFDTEDFNEASAFDSYISQFPFLKDDMLTTMEEDKNWIVGENAPHYLYQSHLTAKRIKDILPHVKLVFFLREPIARAYSQYLHEKPELGNSDLSFETLVDLELPILRRCGHTSTQTGWEGFVRCHQGSEIRASWKVSNDTHAFNSLAKGMYYPALVPFLQHFPPSQLFVMRTEDILLNPSSSFQKLARFLQIDPTYFVERNFYQDEPRLTEEELLSTSAELEAKFPHSQHRFDNTSSSDYPANNYLPHHSQERNVFAGSQRSRHRALASQQQGLSKPYIASIQEPKLSTMYRLQRVFRHLNNRLIELFDQKTASFHGWVYDVDRG